jgi:hypothetical protein
VHLHVFERGGHKNSGPPSAYTGMMTFGHDFVLVGRHNGIGSLPSAITAIADRSNITAIVKRVFIVGYLVLDSHHVPVELVKCQFDASRDYATSWFGTPTVT